LIFKFLSSLIFFFINKLKLQKWFNWLQEAEEESDSEKKVVKNGTVQTKTSGADHQQQHELLLQSTN
jgi:hypothetical protein